MCDSDPGNVGPPVQWCQLSVLYMGTNLHHLDVLR